MKNFKKFSLYEDNQNVVVSSDTPMEVYYGTVNKFRFSCVDRKIIIVIFNNIKYNKLCV